MIDSEMKRKLNGDVLEDREEKVGVKTGLILGGVVVGASISTAGAGDGACACVNFRPVNLVALPSSAKSNSDPACPHHSHFQ